MSELTYQKKLVIFRVGPVKKNTLYIEHPKWNMHMWSKACWQFWGHTGHQCGKFFICYFGVSAIFSKFYLVPHTWNFLDCLLISIFWCHLDQVILKNASEQKRTTIIFYFSMFLKTLCSVMDAYHDGSLHSFSVAIWLPWEKTASEMHVAPRIFSMTEVVV